MSHADCDTSDDYCCPSCGHDFCGDCEEGMLHGHGDDEFCDECCKGNECKAKPPANDLAPAVP